MAIIKYFQLEIKKHANGFPLICTVCVFSFFFKFFLSLSVNFITWIAIIRVPSAGVKTLVTIGHLFCFSGFLLSVSTFVYTFSHFFFYSIFDSQWQNQVIQLAFSISSPGLFLLRIEQVQGGTSCFSSSCLGNRRQLLHLYLCWAQYYKMNHFLAGNEQTAFLLF